MRGGDFATFLRAAAALDLHRIGRASDVFLAVGAYPGDTGHLLPGGGLRWPQRAAYRLRSVRDHGRCQPRLAGRR